MLFCSFFCLSKRMNKEKDPLTLAIRASQSSHVRSLYSVLHQVLNFARAHDAPGSGLILGVSLI